VCISLSLSLSLSQGEGADEWLTTLSPSARDSMEFPAAATAAGVAAAPYGADEGTVEGEEVYVKIAWCDEGAKDEAEAEEKVRDSQKVT
jgi:hypothetical protein